MKKKKKTLSLVFPYSLRGTFSIFWVFIFARKVAAMAGVGKPIPARKEAGGQRSRRYVYLFFSFFFLFSAVEATPSTFRYIPVFVGRGEVAWGEEKYLI